MLGNHAKTKILSDLKNEIIFNEPQFGILPIGSQYCNKQKILRNTHIIEKSKESIDSGQLSDEPERTQSPVPFPSIPSSAENFITFGEKKSLVRYGYN